MDPRVDDIGSFPLPADVDRATFNKAYVAARQAIADGKSLRDSKFLMKNFHRVVVDSFRRKLEAGLDVVTYPQHYDMNVQFLDVVHEAMKNGTYIVDENRATIPELFVIGDEAANLHEQFGNRISLRVCITGPMELYLKEIGAVPYKDVLLMFAETVRRFAQASLLNSKYVSTAVVSLDEPSFGFMDVATGRDTILDVLEKAFSFTGVAKQIHLHSGSRLADILAVRNIDVLSLEYAASPKNIDAVAKRMLEQYDKQIRVGVSRTDINSITAELYEKGIAKPNDEQLVEEEAIIGKRFLAAKEKFGERLTFTGPDCGLGGWPTAEAAQLLLRRTASAVKSRT